MIIAINDNNKFCMTGGALYPPAIFNNNHNIMKIRHVFIFLLLFISCGRSKQTNISNAEANLSEVIIKGSYEYFSIKENKITVDLNKPQQASLLDYFDHIELIPLETNDDVLIGFLRKIIYHQNRYYALDTYRGKYSVFVFDESGKFILQISKYGQGPGEYSVLADMSINPFTGNIDLLSAYEQICTYNLSGQYVETPPQFTRHSNSDYFFYAAHYFIVLDEKTYVFYSVTDDYKLFYYNIDEMKIFRQEFEENPFTRTGSIIVPSFYEYRGKWYFYRCYGNDVYEIYPDSSVKSYSWDFGKYNYDINKMTHLERSNTINKQIDDINQFPYRFRLQGQNNRYVMAEIEIKFEVSAFLMYNKSTHECKYIEHFTDSVKFSPKIITDEYVLSYCNHEELPDFINKEMLDESNRQTFEKLMEIKEELNPIIIKYYFK